MKKMIWQKSEIDWVKWNKAKNIWEFTYDMFKPSDQVNTFWIKSMKSNCCRDPANHISNIRNIF